MTSRRRLMRMLMGLAAATAGGWAVVSGGRPNRYYAGPPSDHFDGVRFYNPGGPRPKGAGAFLKWQLGDGGEAWPGHYASPFPQDSPPQRFTGAGARIVFIGHASFLIQLRGRNVLIDPVWSQRASPLSFIGPSRVNAPGIAWEQLPPIDAVLVTHNHYDHLDMTSIGRLWQQFRPRIVTPLGNDAIMRSGVPGLAASAVDWDQVVELGDGIRVHAEPTVHWSARGFGDRMHALWASFVLESGDTKIYCVGDTAFGDGATFRRVRRRHVRLALALLPIGAYEPRWFMRSNHMNPLEAVEAMALSGAARAFGHHWGTFRLTNEGIERPHKDLAVALAQRALPAESFLALRPGEVRLLT
jgi:L-ascorbate metabolism protein UlaG (beta-lactamase superfamily)